MSEGWPRLNAFCKWEDEPLPTHYNGQAGQVASRRKYFYVQFDGDSSYIDCGSNASLDNIHAGSFTVDFWINPSTPHLIHDGVISKVNEVASQGWAIIAQGLGGIQSWVYAFVFYNTFAFMQTNQRLTNGAWSHVAVSYNHAVDRRIYEAINGAWCTYATQIASAGAIGSDVAWPLVIGASQTNVPFEFLNGGISWARLSGGIRYPIGAAFTPPARCKPPVVDAATIELWALDEGAGAVTAASVVAANQGAMTDCAWHKCK